MSKVKILGQGHHGQKMRLAHLSPLAAYEWPALAENSVQQQRMAPFRPCGGDFGVLRCVRFMFGKTSLVLAYQSSQCLHALICSHKHKPRSMHRVKWRHSNMIDFCYFVGQHGVLCEVKWRWYCRDIPTKLKQWFQKMSVSY